MAELADIAVYLARRGWAVYPQIPLGNTPTANCPRCRRGECPGPRGGCECLTGINPCHALHGASSDMPLTGSRWEHAPRCNPALNLYMSQLVVLDLDCHGDEPPDELAPGLSNSGIANGVGAFGVLLEHLGVEWPDDTLTVETPTGGMHIYYRAPQASLHHCLAAWQVEVKAGACSITAPGSVRQLDDGTTGTYRRISETADPAPFPRWLGEWLVNLGHIPDPNKSHTAPAMPAKNHAGGGHSRRWWERAWNDQINEIANAPQGTRNDVVTRRGLRLFNLTAEAGCPWNADDAERALIDAQHQYAAKTGRPSNTSEYRAVAQATRQRASGTNGQGAVA